MPSVPAVCTDCDFVFNSGIEMSGGATAHLSNNRWTCPRCSGAAFIPEGFYEAVGDTLRVLLTSKRSLSDLQALLAALKREKSAQPSAEAVTETIKQYIPELVEPLRSDGKVLTVDRVIAILVLMVALWPYVSKPKYEGLTQSQLDESLTKVMATRQPASGENPNRQQRRAQAKKARHKQRPSRR